MMESRISFSFLYPIISIIFLLCQSFQVISIASVYPDFLLLLTVIYSISHGSFKGEIYGFFMGFSLDLMSGALFGLNAFIFTFFGAFTSLFQKAMKLPNVIVFVFYLIICTILKYFLYHLFFVIFHSTSLFDWYFFLKIPAEILINIFFGIILYIICARFDGRENYEWF